MSCWRRIADAVAVGVVGGGGEAETDYTFVGFFGCRIELGQAREIADYERKHAGG